MGVELVELEAVQLQVDATKQPPTEFRLLAFGTTASRKGPLVYDEKSAESIRVAETHKGRQPWIDYEHQSLHSPPIEAPAAATFDIDYRADGLYATNVKWRPRAARMVAEGEYMFFSPTVLRDSKTGRVVELANTAPAGLTNDPAIKDMRPLVAARAVFTEDKHMMTTVLVALTGKEDADEAVALSAAVALTDFRREVFALTGKQTTSEALGVLTAHSVAAGEVTRLNTELVALRKVQQSAEVKQLVEKAGRDGKVSPANHPTLVALGERDIVALKTTLDLLPPMPGQSEPVKSPEKSTTSVVLIGLTAEDQKLARMLGTDPAKLAEFKAAKEANPSSADDADEEK